MIYRVHLLSEAEDDLFISIATLLVGLLPGLHSSISIPSSFSWMASAVFPSVERFDMNWSPGSGLLASSVDNYRVQVHRDEVIVARILYAGRQLSRTE
jgi:hypothetical protein